MKAATVLLLAGLAMASASALPKAIKTSHTLSYKLDPEQFLTFSELRQLAVLKMTDGGGGAGADTAIYDF